jgi:DNA-binding GntR family transcriptional regulator
MAPSASSKKRLGEKAYEQIRERIVTLRLRPGEQIDEGALEQQLSIGRTPIREALQRLAGERILDSVPGRGFFVRSISIDDVKSLFEALTTMECIAVHLAAQRIGKDEIRRMVAISDRHKAAMLRHDFLKVNLLNSEFHSSFHAATHNVFLQTALGGIYHQAERLAYLTYTKEAHPQGMEGFNQKAVEDHEALIECFSAGDPGCAVAVITAHCRRFFLRVCHYMEPKIYPLETFLDSDLIKETN